MKRVDAICVRKSNVGSEEVGGDGMVTGCRMSGVGWMARGREGGRIMLKASAERG